MFQLLNLFTFLHLRFLHIHLPSLLCLPIDQALGVVTFALIMASIGELVANSSEAAKKRALFQEKMACVDAWMKSSRMPRHIAQKIRIYCEGQACQILLHLNPACCVEQVLQLAASVESAALAP